MKLWFGLAASAVSAALSSTALATTFLITIDGGDAIFLAGRTDLVIPTLGGPWADQSPATDDGLRRHAPAKTEGLESLPPEIAVAAGDVLSVIAPANGGIDFFNAPSARFFGPAGNADDTSSNLTGLGGISGYQGRQGALTGVFLTDLVPNTHDQRPSTLGVSQFPGGLDYAELSPEIGQVFFIGDGTTTRDPSGLKKIVAPARATRIAFGIPDGFGFGGVPGAYDDNNGSYQIRVRLTKAPTAQQPQALQDPSALCALTCLDEAPTDP